jgi:hypothetical protein
MAWISGNISFKGARQDQIAQAIREKLPGRTCCVSPQIHGWVTVRDLAFDTMEDPAAIATPAAAVSRACGCPALALYLFDELLLCYWLFNGRGELEDESCPDDRPGPDAPLTFEERRGLLGRPERIAALAGENVTEAEVRAALAMGEEPDAAAALEALGNLLGIADVLWGYQDLIDHGGPEEIAGWKDFVWLGTDPGKPPRGDGP